MDVSHNFTENSITAGRLAKRSFTAPLILSEYRPCAGAVWGTVIKGPKASVGGDAGVGTGAPTVMAS